ncbi:MAG TPA: hypothetical protein VHB70_03455 [Parafilimonas sp.]|nr:hypothetical protein [Parafilimonas sp.]
MSKLSFLFLTGAAAFAAYKYSKLSEDEKRELLNKIKNKGKKIYDQFSTDNMKDAFKKFS